MEPMYSPTMPMKTSCTPEQIRRRIWTAAQPEGREFDATYRATATMAITKPASEKQSPTRIAACSGRLLNDTTPSAANLTIRPTEYLLVPAGRCAASKVTAALLKPTQL